MKAILLAAGFGTRLRPLTNTVPKCLVPIKGKPLLQIWLENLTAAGIGPFLINTHYLPEQVEKFVETSPFKKDITIVYETELLGTAGTLRKNHLFFGGQDGMLIHADNYCITDFNAFIETHKTRPAQCELTMMTFQTTDSSSCGIVELDKQGSVIAFHEKVKSPPGNLANGAIYIMSHKLIMDIATGSQTDISTEILPSLMYKIFTFENTGIHLDIGNIKAYEAAQLL